MLETAEELVALQDLLDRSFAAGGAHLGSIVTAERRLTATQVANYLQGVKHVSFATVNSKGEPFVSPLDGWFVHGQFVVSTAGKAMRTEHVRRNPAVSLAHVVGDDIGIWVHGRARIAGKGVALVDEYDRLATQTYGTSPFSWGDVVVMPVEARVMFAYAPDPSKY
jgi:hypothetical protein